MSMNPYMLDEYLDIREVASLSVEGRVITGKEYSSNNEIKKLEKRLMGAVKKNEIPARKYSFYNIAVFLYACFGFLPNDYKIMMKLEDVKELYKKWNYPDMCFNIDETTRSAPPKICWIGHDNALAELFYELWDKKYIAADSKADLLRQIEPHFNLRSTSKNVSEVLRQSLGEKQTHGSPNFGSMPHDKDFEDEKDCFSGVKPSPTPRQKPARRRINKG